MKTNLIWQKFTSLLLGSLILASCSSRDSVNIAPQAASTAPPQEILVTNSSLVENPPTLSPAVSPAESEVSDQLSSTPAPTGPAFSSEIRTYHAVLMLERATDLMIAVIEKILAGEISISDSETIALYNNSFALADESFNEAHPPPEYSDIWSRVYAVTWQYNVVYLWLIQGRGISEENLVLLKESRQFLTIDQGLIEKFLVPRLGEDFITEQQKEVDQHFEKGYGDKLVPTLIP